MTMPSGDDDAFDAVARTLGRVWCWPSQHPPWLRHPAARARRRSTSRGRCRTKPDRWRIFWGKENITVLPKEAGTAGDVLRVAYPAGSFSPGRSDIRGGAGFELRHGRSGAQAACLAYKVRFPVGSTS